MSAVSDASEATATIASRLPGRVLAMHVGGSRLHGVATEDSDLDLVYVFVRPSTEFLGLRPPPQAKLGYEGKIDGPRVVEYKAHEVGKFARMLCQGNPTIVESLWATPFVAKAGWESLRQRRRMFLTRSTLKSYLGYVTSQMRRLEKGQTLHTTGGAYNTKWAYHMLRLIWDAVAISHGDEPQVVYDDGWNHDRLMRVRAGEVAKADVMADVFACIGEIEGRRPWDNLPDRPPEDWIDGWLLWVRGTYGHDTVSTPGDAEKSC